MMVLQLLQILEQENHSLQSKGAWYHFNMK